MLKQDENILPSQRSGFGAYDPDVADIVLAAEGEPEEYFFGRPIGHQQYGAGLPAELFPSPVPAIKFYIDGTPIRDVYSIRDVPSFVPLEDACVFPGTDFRQASPHGGTYGIDNRRLLKEKAAAARKTFFAERDRMWRREKGRRIHDHHFQGNHHHNGEASPLQPSLDAIAAEADDIAFALSERFGSAALHLNGKPSVHDLSREIAAYLHDIAGSTPRMPYR